jgi:hypothetical protein
VKHEFKEEVGAHNAPDLQSVQKLFIIAGSSQIYRRASSTRRGKKRREKQEVSASQIGARQTGETHRFDRVKKTRHTPASLLIASNLRVQTRSKPAKAGEVSSQRCNLVRQKNRRDSGL